MVESSPGLQCKDSCAFARSKGFETVYLWTTDQRQWYERLGWELLEQFQKKGALVSFLKFDKAAHK